MKRLIALFLSLMMFLLAFTACAQPSGTSSDASDASSEVSNVSDESEADKKAVVRIAGMKGPTSIGMVEIMENDEKGTTKNDYEFTIAGTADEITPLLKKGELDIAAVPANLASVLYNNTNGEIQILGVNTLGVLYLVAKGMEIDSVDDLEGKTILATGKGTTPEYTLKHILNEKGIDPEKDVTLDFKAEATEVVAALSQADSGIAMLPQPYVTVAQGKVEGLEIVMDLNKEWKMINGDNGIVTGVFVVRKAFATENPEAVKNFIEEYKVSSAYVNEIV
ncbi:MAG: ABC transporter substrate-binding protein, partial [Clostridia bacterium]|nr:ABC transporter substrate-binding protein [Clostridia bacterium]